MKHKKHAPRQMKTLAEFGSVGKLKFAVKSEPSNWFTQNIKALSQQPEEFRVDTPNGDYVLFTGIITAESPHVAPDPETGELTTLMDVPVSIVEILERGNRFSPRGADECAWEPLR